MSESYFDPPRLRATEETITAPIKLPKIQLFSDLAYEVVSNLKLGTGDFDRQPSTCTAINVLLLLLGVTTDALMPTGINAFSPRDYRGEQGPAQAVSGAPNHWTSSCECRPHCFAPSAKRFDKALPTS
jgi:hypothetical protein